MKSANRVHKRVQNREAEGHYGKERTQRRTIEYVRVSTDIQATEGLSLEAQQSAIEGYCALHGIKLVQTFKDVMSRNKDVRPGLQEALSTLQRSADILIVLKFDRLNRSIKHFCELYERYFKDRTKELITIRESIQLDSSLKRALMSILLMFAQIEQKATEKRTREAIQHIRKSGYHFEKVPYGKRRIPTPDNPRMKLLMNDDEELAVIAQIKSWAIERIGATEIARRLNAKGTKPPQKEKWTKSLIYNLRLRLSHICPKPHNERPYSDSEVKERILDLRAHGHTLRQIASILNEQRWIPLKDHQFTEQNVHRLLAHSDPTKLLSPKRYLKMMLTKIKRTHVQENPRQPFERPEFPTLTKLLEETKYKTPKDHDH